MEENKYLIIERYRIVTDEPWTTFGPRMEKEMGISWQTLHKVVNGKTNPSARTRFKLDNWLRDNYHLIFNAISKKENHAIA